MGKLHHLKIEDEYYREVERGIKKFEIRKNDRDYKEGDLICFRCMLNGFHLETSEPYRITYIFYGGKYGLDGDYCVFQIELEN